MRMPQAISKTPQTLASEIHIKALDNPAHFLLLEGDISPDGIPDFAIRFDGLTSLSVGAIIV